MTPADNLVLQHKLQENKQTVETLLAEQEAIKRQLQQSRRYP